MASKDKKEKLSTLERDSEYDIDVDFDDNSEDEISDLNFDFGADTSKKNRSPITHITQGAAEAISAGAPAFTGNIKDALEDRLPEVSKFVGEIGQVTSDVMYLGQEFQKEIGPTIQQLKRAGRALGPRVKQFLPQSLQKKYDSLMSEEKDLARQTAKIKKEDTENMAINASMDAIFSKNAVESLKVQEEQFKDQKADVLIDRALEGKRHSENARQFHQMSVSLSFQQKFIEQIQIPFLKKDLELKYRHFFIARDILAETKGIAKVLTDQLDQIRHNTALPDIQKQTKLESVKQERRQRISQLLNGWAADVGKRLKERFLSPASEMIQQMGTAAELMSETTAMQDEMEGVKGVGAQTGGMLGKMLGGKASKMMSRFLFGERYGGKGLFGNQLAKLNHRFSNLGTKLSLKAKSYVDNNEGGLLSEMMSLFMPNITKSAGSVTNVQMKDPSAPATLTNQAVLSITTIIPGYLAKAVKHLETIATGKEVEELDYDAGSQDFIRASVTQKRILQQAFKTRDERNRAWGEKMGIVGGLYKANVGDTSDKRFGSSEGGGTLKSFNDLQDSFRQFLSNSMRNRHLLEPQAIAEYAGLTKKQREEDPDGWSDTLEYLTGFDDDDKSWQYKRYIEEMFKGVDDPVSLIQMLATMLYDENGKVVRDNVATIDNIIINGMQVDGFLDTFADAAARGQIRRVQKYIKKGGREFLLNEEEIDKAMLEGVDTDSEKYKSGYDSKSLQSEILHKGFNEATTWKDALEDSEFKEGAVGWFMDKFVRKNMDKIDKAVQSTKSKATELYEKAKDKTANARKKLSDKTPGIALKLYDKLLPTMEGMEGLSTEEKVKALAEKLKEMRKNEAMRDNITESDALLDIYAAQQFPELYEQIYGDDSAGEDVSPPPVSPQGRGRRGGKAGKGRQGNIRPTSVTAKVNFPRKITAELPKDSVFGVNLINIDDVSGKLSSAIAEKFKNLELKVIPQVDPNDKQEQDFQPVVDAVQHFESVFKEYADSTVESKELLKAMAAGIAGMSGQLDKLIGNTTSTFKKVIGLAGKGIGKAFTWTKKGLSYVHPFKWTASAARGAWWASKKAYGGAKWGAGKLWDGAKWGNDKILKPTWRRGVDLATGVAGMGLMGVELLGKGLGNAYTDMLTGFSNLRKKVGDFKNRQVEKFRNAKNKVKKAVGDKIKGTMSRLRYVDIYIKDRIDPKNPHLTAKQQEDGVFFVDNGDRVLTSWSINRPVKKQIKDASGKVIAEQIVITQDDLKAGLVTLDGKPIGGFKGLLGKAMSLAGKGGKKALDSILGSMGFMGNFIKDMLAGKNPLANLMTNALGLGLKGLKNLGGGMVKLGRRMFGLNEGLTKEGLYEVVGSRLDVIIGIMKKVHGIKDADVKMASSPDGSSKIEISGGDTKPSEQQQQQQQQQQVSPSSPAGGSPALPPGSVDTAPGDADGDGKRDTIFEDRANKEKDKEEKEERKLRHAFYKVMIKLKDKLIGGDDDKKKSILSKIFDFIKHPLKSLMAIKSAVMGSFMALLAGKKLLGGLLKGIFGLPGTLVKLLGPLLSRLMGKDDVELPESSRGRRGRRRGGRGRGRAKPRLGGLKKTALSIGAGLGLGWAMDKFSGGGEAQASELPEDYTAENNFDQFSQQLMEATNNGQYSRELMQQYHSDYRFDDEAQTEALREWAEKQRARMEGREAPAESQDESQEDMLNKDFWSTNPYSNYNVSQEQVMDLFDSRLSEEKSNRDSQQNNQDKNHAAYSADDIAREFSSVQQGLKEGTISPEVCDEYIKKIASSLKDPNGSVHDKLVKLEYIKKYQMLKRAALKAKQPGAQPGSSAELFDEFTENFQRSINGSRKDTPNGRYVNPYINQPLLDSEKLQSLNHFSSRLPNDESSEEPEASTGENQGENQNENPATSAVSMDMPQERDDSYYKKAGGFDPEAMWDAAKTGGVQYVAKKVIQKTASKAVGFMARAAVLGAGGFGTGGLSWGLLAVDAIDTVFFGGKYSQDMYNYLGIMEDEFVKQRCALYGVPTDGWSIGNLFGGSILRQVIKLEEVTYEISQGRRGPFTEDELKEWTDKFDLDEDDPDQVAFWSTWYSKRFLPIFKAYLESLDKHRYRFEDSYHIPEEEQNQIISEMEGAFPPDMVNMNILQPTKESWKKLKDDFKKNKDKQAKGEDTSKPAKPSIDGYEKRAKEIQKQQKEDQQRQQQLQDTAKQMEKTAQNAKTSVEAFETMFGPLSAEDMRMLNGGNRNERRGVGEDFSAPGSVPNGASVGDPAATQNAGPPPDMSGVSPANLKGKDGELGSYVRRFESGGKGTAAVAYDAPGGTSYGSYQFSSRRGSLKEFVAWLKDHSPSAYNALWPMIDQANTGSKQGAFVNAWLEQVKQGNLTHQHEHEYIKGKHYDKALKLIAKGNPELAQFIEGNRALQESLWSASVQHGPGGAARLFKDHFKPNIDSQTFLRTMYGNRFTSTYFPELSRKQPDMLRKMAANRGKEELGIMLALAGQEPVGANQDANPPGTEAAMNANTGGGETSSPTPGGNNESAGGGMQSSPDTQARLDAQMRGVNSTSQSSNTASTAAPSPGGDSSSPSSNTAPGNQAQSSLPQPKFEDTAAKSDDSTPGDAAKETRGGAIDKSGIKVKAGVDFDGLNPHLKKRFTDMAAEFKEKYGQPILINSGKRSMAQQAALRAKYGSRGAAKPNPLAPHISGLALDASSAQMNRADSDGLLKKHGLWRPLKNGLGGTKAEAWHVEVSGSRDPAAGQKITKATLAKFSGDIPGGADTGRDGSGSQVSPANTPTQLVQNDTSSAPSSPAPVQTASSEMLSPSAPDTSSASAPAPAPQPEPVASQPAPVEEPQQQQAPEVEQKDYTQLLTAAVQLLGQLVSINSGMPKQLAELMDGMKGVPGYQGVFNGSRAIKQQVV